MKSMKPPHFHGDPEKDSLKLDEFLWKVDRYFHGMQVPQESRVAALPFYLTGTAARYWRTEIEPRLLDGSLRTYDEVKQDLQTKFADRLEVAKAREKFAQLKYKKSVSQLTGQIDKLSLVIPDLSDAEKKAKLMQSLPTSIRVVLVVTDANEKPYRELANMAEKIDHELQYSGTSTSGNHTSNSSSTPMQINAIDRRKFTKFPKKGDGGKPKGDEHKADDDRPKLTKLTPEEKERLREQGACFKCRQPGHTAFNCPTRKNGPNGPPK
jgi:hypothetical protein